MLKKQPENRFLIFLKFWFPVLCYSAIIFYVSSLERLEIPLKDIINVDKLWHCAEYLPFGFLLARALFNTNESIRETRLLCLITVLSFLYGLSDETHQLFVPGRQFSWIDMTADMIGGAAGAALFNFINHQLAVDTHKKDSRTKIFRFLAHGVLSDKQE